MRARRGMAIIASALVLSMSAGAPCKGKRRHRDEVMDKIRTVKLLELVQALDLDEKTGIRLAEVMKKYDANRRELHDKARDKFSDLQAEVSKDTPDESRLKLLIADLFKIRSKMTGLDEQEFKELQSILTPLQQAKYILVMQRFRQKIRKMMKRRGMGRPGQGPPGPRMHESPTW